MKQFIFYDFDYISKYLFLKNRTLFILQIVIFCCITHSPSYGLTFDFPSGYTENQQYSDNYNHNSNYLLNINLGFLGYKDYEKRKNYLDNCFSYRCTNFGINFKINLPANYLTE